MEKEIPYVEFAKERDFGEVLSDTFVFLKYNILKITIPVLYIALPLTLLQMLGFFMLPDVLTNDDPFSSVGFGGAVLGFSSFQILLGIPASAMITALIYYYILLYIQNKGNNFTAEELWKGAFKYLGSFIGFSFAYSFIVFFTTLCLVLPGIYLGTTFSMLWVIHMHEGKDFMASFRRCNELLSHDNSGGINISKWFNLFLVLFLGVIIFYVLSFVVSIPFILINFLGIFELTDYSYEMKYFLEVVYQSLESLVTSVLSAIIIVIIALQYYSFREKKEATSLMQRIEDFGSSQNNNYENS